MTSGKSLGAQFRWYFAAVGISGVGDGLRVTALPLLTVTLTSSPLAIAAVAAAQGLPWLLFSLPAGALVDRWDRRRVVVIVNSTRAGLATVLAVLTGLGEASVPLLAAVAFGLTTGETFVDAATRAVLPAVVPTDRLESANGRLFVAETGSVQLAGPPLGSALFAVSRTVPFALDAASFAAGVLCFGRLRLPRPATRAPSSLRHEMAEGARWLWTHRVLRTLAVPLLVMNLASEAVFAVFVLFALRELHVGRSVYGLLFVAYAAGGLVGSATAARLRNRIGDGPAIVGSVALFGAPFLIMAGATDGYLAGGMMLLIGIGEGVWGVLTMSLRQAAIPDRLLGRVLNVFRLLGWGSLALGAVIGGVTAHAFGLRAPIYAAGVVILLTAVVVAPVLTTSALRRARD
ncbi:MAG TPA: MFS transporter [Pseudonocardiaceae bacterium]